MGPSFQMLWDCPRCGARGLLGVTHRHCPGCGTPQDPKARYFPEPGSEVEALGHQWVGVDRTCRYCETPNSAKASHCGNCGASLDDTPEVALHQDVSRTPPQEPFVVVRPKAKRSRSPLRILLGILFVGIVLLGWLFSSRERKVEVVEQGWERRVHFEELGPIQSGSWCDQVPGDASVSGRDRRERSHERVPDGEECTQDRVDQGDGSFRMEEHCQTRYREEPIYDDWCSWTAVRWHSIDDLVSRGPFTQALQWPAASFLESQGNVRESGRDETWHVRLRDQKGRILACSLPPSVGSQCVPGSRWVLPVRNLGSPRCDRMKLVRD